MASSPKEKRKNEITIEQLIAKLAKLDPKGKVYLHDGNGGTVALDRIHTYEDRQSADIMLSGGI